MEESDETDSESDHETVVVKKSVDKWYLIRNRGRFIQTWNLVIVIFAVYNSITQPLHFAWNIEGRFTSVYFLILEYLADAIFFIDLLFGFNTTYFNIATGDEVT